MDKNKENYTDYNHFFHNVVIMGLSLDSSNPLQWITATHKIPNGTVRKEPEKIAHFLYEMYLVGNRFVYPNNGQEILDWYDDIVSRIGTENSGYFDFLLSELEKYIKDKNAK